MTSGDRSKGFEPTEVGTLRQSEERRSPGRIRRSAFGATASFHCSSSLRHSALYDQGMRQRQMILGGPLASSDRRTEGARRHGIVAPPVSCVARECRGLYAMAWIGLEQLGHPLECRVRKERKRMSPSGWGEGPFSNGENQAFRGRRRCQFSLPLDCVHITGHPSNRPYSRNSKPYRTIKHAVLK